MNPAIMAINRGGTQYGPTQTIPATYKNDEIILEGAERSFSHTKYDSQGKILSNRVVKGRLMRNVSGSTLARGRLVVANSSYPHRRISGYATANARIAGVIDSHLSSSAGVRNGDLCWVMYEGPEYVVFAGGNAVAVGDWLVSNASGKFINICGYYTLADTVISGTVMMYILNAFGVADETCVTGDTDSLKLCDLRVR